MPKILCIFLLLFSGLCFSVPEEDLHCIALNVYHEARGEKKEGALEAVAWVTINRANSFSPEWPRDVCDVVYQPSRDPERPLACAFSWTCDEKEDTPKKNRLWKMSVAIAKLVASGEAHYDVSMGATHYARCDLKNKPRFMRVLTKVAEIGAHCFYK